MDPSMHDQGELFCQLGLPSEPAEIELFIAAHRPLPGGVALAEATFWTPSQAQFLREALSRDADWASAVDQLSARLSG